MMPEMRGIEPGYEQKRFPFAAGTSLTLAASRDGPDGSVTIHQDVSLYATRLKAGEEAVHSLDPARTAWLQVARGAIQLGHEELGAGGGAALKEEATVAVRAIKDAEILFFDMRP